MAEAIESYDRAIAISPDYYQARLTKGDLLAELARSEEARAVFEEGLQQAMEKADSLYIRTFPERMNELANTGS